jgi:uncharacterized protein
MHTDIYTILFVCLFIFIAGFIDSIAGGGGLISLPAYLSAGLPPHLALGTNKFSSTFGTFVAFSRFLKNGKISYKSALASVACALPGSYLGTRLTLLINEVYLRYILIILLPCIIVLVLVRKNFGDKDTSSSLSTIKIITLSAITGLVIGAYDGFFGPGTGTFLILIYTGIMGFNLTTASGNTKVVNLASNIAALATFIVMGKVIYLIGIPAAFAGILGNWIGSGLAIKNGAKVIRPIFLAVVILLFFKVLYDFLKGMNLLPF